MDRLWVALIVFRVSVYGQFDPCLPGNHVELLSDQRSSEYINRPGDTPQCDRDYIVEGNYYVFVNSNGIKTSLPESCVRMDRCQTHAPIWLDGQHSSVVGSEVTRKVCRNEGFNGLTGADRCCDWQANIQIRLCAGNNGGANFYAYRLVPPDACDSRYCSGSTAPACQVDYVVVNGICQPRCPIQARDPVLSGPIQLPPPQPGWPQNDFQFSCTASVTKALEGDEKLEISWKFDGQNDNNIPVTILDTNTGLTATLKGTDINGHMGENVQCAVRSFRGDHTGAQFCIERFSQQYRMEIRAVTDITTQPFVISNPATFRKTITFTATIPPTCSPSPQKCAVTINVRTTEQNANILMNKVCSVLIDSSAWSDQTKTASASKSFEVSTVKDTCGNNQQDFVLHFQTINQIGTTPFKNYDIVDYRFQFEKVAGAMCKSTNDPQIKTFDGLLYGTLKIGQFYLVRNGATNSLNRFEIQVRMNTCGTRPASCNCAVSVREGNTALSIDHCIPNLDAPVLWAYPEQLTPGAAIYRIDSETYRLCLPSGSCTRVQIGTWGGRKWINIYVENLPPNVGPISGMCGNFDGDKANDRSAQLNIESYRIPLGESLFEGYVQPVQGAAPEPFERCTCQEHGGNEILCGTRPITGCLGSQNEVPLSLDSILFVTDNQSTPGRKKKSTSEHENKRTFGDIMYPFDHGETDSGDAGTGGVWPTPSGITEAQARQLCQADIQSAAALAECKAKVGNDLYEGLIQQCVNDLKITDSIEVSGRVWQALQEDCKAVARNDDGGQALQQTIVAQTCPGKCSGHGTCSSSVCTCSSGYIGADCSVRTGTPPAVTGLQDKGVCDTERRACKRISLYSSEGKFVEIDSMTCRVTTLQVENFDLLSATETTSELTEAKLVSKWEVFCALPESAVFLQQEVTSHFRVELSYDGSIFSPKREVTVHTSVCMECSEAGVCSLKDDTCAIDGQCYEKGDSRPSNKQFECRPETDPWKWTCISQTGDCTEVPTAKPTENPQPDVNMYLVIGIVVAVIVILLLVIVGVVALFKYRNTQSRENRPQQNAPVENNNVYEMNQQLPDKHVYAEIDPQSRGSAQRSGGVVNPSFLNIM